MTPLQEIIMDLVEQTVMDVFAMNREVDVEGGEPTAQALTAIAGVVEECLPEMREVNVSAHLAGNTQAVANNSYNSAVQEIRNNLKEAGVLK